MNAKTAEAMMIVGIKALIESQQADDAEHRNVKDALEHLFEQAGYSLEIGEGFAYAVPV